MPLARELPYCQSHPGDCVVYGPEDVMQALGPQAVFIATRVRRVIQRRCIAECATGEWVDEEAEHSRYVAGVEHFIMKLRHRFLEPESRLAISGEAAQGLLEFHNESAPRRLHCSGYGEQCPYDEAHYAKIF